MTNSRIRVNSAKGLMMFFLFIAMCIKSCTASAQVFRGIDESLAHKEKKIHHDILRKLKVRNHQEYLGGEISLATARYALRSDIAALAGLPVSYLGTNVGFVAGNSLGKIRASAGLYYSDPSVPYTMQMYQERISTNLYLLKLVNMKHRTVEPYACLGITRQQTQFYGNYLDNGKSTNYSVTELPLLGTKGFSLMNFGAGVEYKIEYPHNFIHVFGEMNYAMLVSSNTSNQAFSKTQLSSPSSISVGVTFGLLK